MGRLYWLYGVLCIVNFFYAMEPYIQYDAGYLSQKSLTKRYGLRAADYMQNVVPLDVPDQINTLDSSTYPLELKWRIKNEIGDEALYALYAHSYQPKKGPTIFAHDRVLAMHNEYVLRKTMTHTVWVNNIGGDIDIRLFDIQKRFPLVKYAAIDYKNVILGGENEFYIYSYEGLEKIPLHYCRNLNGLALTDNYIFASYKDFVEIFNRDSIERQSTQKIHIEDACLFSAYGSAFLYTRDNWLCMCDKRHIKEYSIVKIKNPVQLASVYINEKKLLLGMEDGTIKYFDCRNVTRPIHVLKNVHKSSVMAITEYEGSIISGSKGQLVTWRPGFDFDTEFEQMSITELATISALLKRL